MGCTPWEAAGMSHNQHPEFWQSWALAIAADEAKAAEYKRRQNAKGKRSGAR